MSPFNGIGMTSQRSRDRLIQQLKAEGIHNPLVLEAMQATPRHLFIDEALASRSYENTALPIGKGQTISQPYIVARMTELLLGEGNPMPKKVLEIGMGSGYQTAILARIFEQVYTVERIASFRYPAKRRFQQLDLHNIQYRHIDGYEGWTQHSPFDAIIVTAAAEEVPENLLQQLKTSGKMIIPVGGKEQQVLMEIKKTISGYTHKILETVRFVPFLEGCC